MTDKEFANETKALNDAYDDEDLDRIDQSHTNLATMINQARPEEHNSAEETKDDESSGQSTSTP